VSPKGARSYSCLYRVKLPKGSTPAPVQRYTIGPVSEVTLTAARETVRRIREAARLGRDLPAEMVAASAREATEAAKAKAAAGSFAELVERFLADGKRRKGQPLAESTRAAYARTLNRDVVPVLGAIPPAEVTRAHVRGIVDGIRDKGHPVQANRTLAAVSRLFNWAASKDLVPSNPCAGLTQTAEAARERVYRVEELRRIVAASQGGPLEHLVSLLLLTAARAGEWRQARWEDLDLDVAEWTVRATDQKGGTRVLPLPRAALAVLRAIGPRPEGYILPAATRSGHAEHAQSQIVALREAAGVEDFRLHDLRRTVATRLAAAGTRREVVETILGHSMGKVESIYNRHGYLPEMRAALEAWSAELERLLSGREGGAEVVAFRRA
jgi:integrase